MITLRFALNGRIASLGVQTWADIIQVMLEPHWSHRPRGGGRFVVRELKPIRFDPETRTATCISVGEYWYD